MTMVRGDDHPLLAHRDEWFRSESRCKEIPHTVVIVSPSIWAPIHKPVPSMAP